MKQQLWPPWSGPSGWGTHRRAPAAAAGTCGGPPNPWSASPAGCRVCTAQSRAGETDGVGTRRTVDSAFPNASQQSTCPRVTWAVVGGTEPAAAEVTTNRGGFTPRCAAECETRRSAKMPNCAGNNPSLMTRRRKTWDAVGSRAITTLTSLAPSLLFLRR